MTSLGLFRRTVSTFTAETITTMIGLALSIYLARKLGVANCGALGFLVSLTTAAHAFGMLGMDTAAVYHTGRKTVPPDQLAGTAIALSVMFGVAIAGVFWLASLAFPSYVAKSEWRYLAMILAVIPVTFPAQICYHLVWGQDRIEICNLLRILSAAVGLLVNLVLVAGLELGLQGAVWAVVVSNVLYLGMTAAAVGFGPPIRWRLEWDCVRALLGYGARCYPAAVLAFLMVFLPRFMIWGLASNDDDAGRWWFLFDRAMIVDRGWTILSYSVVIPLMGAAVRQSPVEVRQTTTRVCRLTLAFSVIVGTVCVLGAKWVLLPWGQDVSNHAATAMRILVPGMIVLTLGKFAARGLQALDRPGLVSAASAMLVAANFALGWWLIPRWGTDGAALAATMCYVIYGLIVVLALARITGARLSDFAVLGRVDAADLIRRLRRR